MGQDGGELVGSAVDRHVKSRGLFRRIQLGWKGEATIDRKARKFGRHMAAGEASNSWRQSVGVTLTVSPRTESPRRSARVDRIREIHGNIT